MYGITSYCIPKATVQQSLLGSPSPGSMLATGESLCRVSHTFTVPGKQRESHNSTLNEMAKTFLCLDEE